MVSTIRGENRAAGEGAAEKGAFGRLLRLYREGAGLRQERLAERAGLSVPAISNLERGVSRPRLETVNLLAEALALPAEHRAALLAAALRERATPPPPPVQAVPAPRPRHNLPAPPNALLGRERQVAAVGAQVQEPAMRLLTLTGVGGVGKTRLALAVGAELVDHYPDGVWLAELAPLADPALVPGVVARVLGLREEPGRPLADTLVAGLADRRLLLVLDNCEHLLGACADLASRLLRACPAVRILATSRERLGVSGEQVHQVPTLGVPDPRHLPPPELLGSYEAVRLFVARAQARRHDFALGEQTAPAVATICERLDGIPLALELAAAWVASLPLQAIAARLDERFRLLTLGPRDVLPRQQTLQATMDWSWDLLDDQERTLLRRISVFAGGWTLAAAEAVCAGEDIHAGAVLDLVDGLASKSLVQVDHTDGGVRYRLLETVRQYAGEQMAGAGELEATRERLLGWCVAMAEAAEPHLRGPEQDTWLARLDHEHPNMRAALRWAHDHGEDAQALRLAGAIWRFWDVRGYLGEGRGWLERALAGSREVPADLRATALKRAGSLALLQGEYGQAAALFEEALALFRALGDRHGAAGSLTNLGIVAHRQGKHAHAAALFEAAVALARECGDAMLLAKTLGNLAAARGRQGEYQREDALLSEALALFRALGDRQSIAVALEWLGLGALRRGHRGQAAALFEEALALFRALGDRHGAVTSLNNLGGVALARGDHARAAALLEEGLLLARDIGARDQLAGVMECLAWVAAARGQPHRAAQIGGAAEVLLGALGVPLIPEQQTGHDQAVQAMQAALGDEALAAAWASGRALSLEEAVALALWDDASGQ